MSTILSALSAARGDAVLIQPRHGTLFPDYDTAHAIIHRGDDQQWTFHTLINIEGKYHTGAGVMGNANDVVSAAEYQFGSDIHQCSVVDVFYHHKGFPVALKPH